MLKAELSGFKTATTEPLQVEAKAIVRLDFTLQLGAIEENVLVTGQSPLLQTESVTVGEVISAALPAALRHGAPATPHVERWKLTELARREASNLPERATGQRALLAALTPVTTAAATSAMRVASSKGELKIDRRASLNWGFCKAVISSGL